MPFYKKNNLFYLFFLCFSLALAQNYPGKNHTAATDLPNNSVRSLLIDSDNALWIGTENGLVKKENEVFQYFFEEDGLALNSCWAIAEDKNKKLWFGSYGEGLSIYDGFNFQVISEKDGLVHNEITKLFAFENHMYVGTSNGVSKININTLEIESWNDPNEDALVRIDGFFEYKNQVYVATYRTGLYTFTNGSAGTEFKKVNNHKFIYAVFKDQDSIFSSNKGFFTKTALPDYTRDSDFTESTPMGRSIIWDYIRTNDNRIFAAAWGIYDTNGGIYEIENNQLISRNSEFNISSNEVISLAYDRKFEKLYVGTKDRGLFEISLDPQIKFHEIASESILDFATSDSTSAILFSDAIILNKGKYLKILKQSQLKEWEENYLATTTLPLPKHADDFYELDYSIKASEIKFYDIKVWEDNFWINTNIGVFAISATGKLQQYLPLHTEEINFTPEGALIETNPYGGTRVYSNIDSLTYQHFEMKNATTPTMVVSSMHRKNKTYFLSVFSGLYTWENDHFRSYLDEEIWSEKKLKHITTLGKNIAISNEFGDIFIINDGTSFKIIEEIPRANIQGNSISFLEEYKGNLIIGTERGLTLYKDNRFIFLDKEQGLEKPLISAQVVGNRLTIGSVKGFYLVDLEAITRPTALVNRLEVEDILINNTENPLGSKVNNKRIQLAHDENTILIKYSTNAHPYPNKLKYQYRLKETEEWSNRANSSEIFLPYLPPGSYDIDVRVIDESTGLDYNQELIYLSVLPPFWKTWWFVVLAIFTLLVIIYSFYRYQIRQHRKFEEQKSKIQQRFEETKMEALLSQMNPHFIFNAMNSIQYYIMDNDIENATIFLGDFAKLIRLNLDHCTKPTILLVEEIEYLESYIRVENTRFKNAIQVILEVDPAIDTFEVEIPTMLLQTFVENVFVHAFPNSIENPTLRISFNQLSKEIIQCKIEDNGIGYNENYKNSSHNSKGLRLVKERLDLLGYKVEEAVKIISEKNKGTRVIITLKV